MTIDANDPKLTAYALGELDDNEQTEVEAQLAQSPELQRAVDEIRETVGLLTTEFQAEPCPTLSDEQRHAIDSAAARANGAATPHSRRFTWRSLRIPASLAAAVLIFVGAWNVLPRMAPTARRTSQLARSEFEAPVDKETGLRPGVPSNLLTPPYIENESRPGERYYFWSAGLDSSGYRIIQSDGLGDLSDGQQGGGNEGAFRLRQGTPANNSGPSRAMYARSGGNERRYQVTLPTSPKTYSGQGGLPGEDMYMAKRLAPEEIDNGVIAGTAYLSTEAALNAALLAMPVKDALMNIEWRPPDENGNYFYSRGTAFMNYSTSIGDSYLVYRAGERYIDVDGDGRYFYGGAEGFDSISFGYEIPFVGPPYDPEHNTESYDRIVENPFSLVSQQPLSTFSIDVDTASYANVRRFLTQGSLPPPGAVRIEEMINYFDYDYPQPTGDDPFSVNVEIAECPWEPDHRLARVGLKGYDIIEEERAPANLVFLIDVSGSMSPSNKLPLLKESMRLLIDELSRDDAVAMVVYAGASGLVLPSTSCAHKSKIFGALDDLRAGGSTNGGAGIELAYEIAVENFIEGGINRVILATDGDFNVGITIQDSLIQLIEEKAKSGVFLSVLGFGTGNLNDSTMEKLADKGNGNYAYIDNINEGRKVLVDQMGGTLVTIAKDVKIQIEFNPQVVSAYRLIGYENRVMAAQDFNDDTKDAGEIGAGHTVTALFEIVPAGESVDLPSIDPLVYQTAPEPTAEGDSGEMMTIKLRYKQPDGDTSELIEVSVTDSGGALVDSSDDFAFQAAVASFGMLLRGSEHAGSLTLEAVLELAGSATGEDPWGYREEFLTLVERAIELR